MQAAGRAYSNDDIRYMQRALDLADRAKGHTFPNPAVGAVIVRDGTVVGEGMTDRCGGPHAERRALKRAGRRARGATMYVSLEPCCHYGRTPPCTDAIIAAGIKRVLAAAKDPSPPMSGKGLRALRRAGIDTGCGLLRTRAEQLNEDFFWWARHAKPWVSLKLAMTLDGRIADSRGASKWITGTQSRAFVHDLRRRHGAVVVGRGTLVADNPSLTVRHVRGVSPVRVAFVRSGRVPASSAFARTASEVRSIVVCGGNGPPRKYVRRSGVEVWNTGCTDTGTMARAFLRMAAEEEEMRSVLLEGGQRLASAFLGEGLVNRVYLFYGNKLLGDGLDGLRLSPGMPLDRCVSLSNTQVERFGADVMVTGLVRWPS